MAYRKTDKVRQQLADKQARILEAARQLIVDGGFHQAPVAAIAARADVSTGTVYRYYKSKSDLFAEVVAQVSQRELEVIAAIAMADGPAVGRLEEAIRSFATRALHGRRLAYALMAEPVTPEVDLIRLRYRRALGRVYETIIERGIRDREFPAQDSRASAACLVGACIEGLIGPLSPEALAGADDAEPLVAAILGFCIRAVAGQTARPAADGIDGPVPITV